jgi:hypothetical protein
VRNRWRRLQIMSLAGEQISESSYSDSVAHTSSWRSVPTIFLHKSYAMNGVFNPDPWQWSSERFLPWGHGKGWPEQFKKTSLLSWPLRTAFLIVWRDAPASATRFRYFLKFT